MIESKGRSVSLARPLGPRGGGRGEERRAEVSDPRRVSLRFNLSLRKSSDIFSYSVFAPNVQLFTTLFKEGS